MSAYRVYEHVGKDGYPPEWHATIKHLVRDQAGPCCERCGHSYRKGDGRWSICSSSCSHDSRGVVAASLGVTLRVAEWRILTVHHLNGIKADCRWWNLAALCQRCHLRIQKNVQMERVWPWAHSSWFEVHAAGWYAHAYLGQDLDREQTIQRIDELLALERSA